MKLNRITADTTYCYPVSEKESRYHKLYIDIAFRVAEMSFAKRRKVGAVLVYDGNISSFGFNGTPAGYNNLCEDLSTGKTLPTVLHAEENLINKARWHNWINADLYITKEPCIECARKLLRLGCKFNIYYSEISLSKNLEGILLLESNGINCFQIVV